MTDNINRYCIRQNCQFLVWGCEIKSDGSFNCSSNVPSSEIYLTGLRDLLAYKDVDLEDVFSLNFTLTEENYGENREVELKENGRNISVTQVRHLHQKYPFEMKKQCYQIWLLVANLATFHA